MANHFPHKLSPLMRAMVRHPPIVEVPRELVGPDLKCMQSMLFVKNAGKPGQAWHHDETFIPTRGASLTGVWIALDDATIVFFNGFRLHRSLHNQRRTKRTAVGAPVIGSGSHARVVNFK